MSEWEYKKIALSELPRGRDDVDVLNAAGDNGWELVAILANHVAYLKREIEDMDRSEPGGEDLVPPAAGKPNGSRAVKDPGRTSDGKAKYRDAKTSETWSGRGRMPNWLKKKQDAGEDIDDYLV